MRRVLVACVGNVLRRDDGFGVAVAQALLAGEPLPEGVDLIETGIGGMGIVHELLRGYDALVLVDALDRGEPPGTLLVLEPAVSAPAELTPEQWHERFSNLHLAEPSRVLLLAKALGVLPERVLVVGCQPREVDDLGQGLSPPVEAAVPRAAEQVRQLAASLSLAPMLAPQA